MVAHAFRDARRHGARRVGVVFEAQHDERVAQPCEAEADAPLRHRFLVLLLERPRGDFQHIVQHADRGRDDLAEALEIESGSFGKFVLDESGQVDRPQATAPVRRQRLFRARVGRLDALAVAQVVVDVDAVEEQDPRLGVVVRRAHDLVPELARAYRLVDPQAVLALAGFLVRLRLVHQLDLEVHLDREHEVVGDADRDVEVGKVALVLGVDEFLDVRVVAAQHAHLRAAARARGLDRLAGAVEDAHVGERAARARVGAFHLGAARANGGEVVAHPAAAPHGLGRFLQRGVDARAPVDHFGDRVADWLHEAVDERRLQRDAGGGIDAPGGDEAFFLRLEEAPLPLGALALALDLGEGARHAAAHFGDGLLGSLGVLLEQRVAADFLL